MAVVIVWGSIDLLKVAETVVLMATPVAVSAGFFELTTGAMLSTAVPAVKLHE